MNTSRKLLLAGVAALATAAASSAFAQNSAQASVNSSVTVVRGIQLSGDQPLNFGRIALVGSGNDAVITVSADGSTTTTTGATQVSGTGSGYQRGRFTVTGEGGQAINISLGQSGFDTDHVLSGLTSSVGTTANIGAGSPGTLQFYVGGVMTVKQTATAGNTTGQVTATVSYQ